MEAADPTIVIGVLYAVVYLFSGCSLLPMMAGHTLTEMTIEPWLVLAAVSGQIRSRER